jgi:hypothetical protein
MNKAFATIESWDLPLIIRHGYIPCIVLLIFGAVITSVWSDHLKNTIETPRYNRGIYINLSGISMGHWQLQLLSNGDTDAEENSLLPENESMIEFDLFNVTPNVGVILLEERQAYSNLMNTEKSGPLAVRNFGFKSTGELYFDVGVGLKKDDQRIVALIDRMNHVRNLIISKLDKKMVLLERRIALLNAALIQLKKNDSKGYNKDLISVLRGEKEFVGHLATVIRNRLPTIRKPIKVPILQKMLPVHNHAKRIFACALATLICSLLSGFLFGFARLMRKQAVHDTDSAAVLPP